MYEAFQYVAENGILLEKDYAPYKRRQGNCDKDQVKRKWHYKVVGQRE